MSVLEPTILVHMTKSFNPFRSVHNALSLSPDSAQARSAPARSAPAAPEQRQEHDNPQNESWHTNPPYRSIQPHSPTNSSWFSGWTSSAKSKSPKSVKYSLPASVITAEDAHVTENLTSISQPAVTLSQQLPLSLSSQHQLAPAISMTMNRGTTISPRQDVNSPQILLSSQQNALGALAAVTGGCMAIPQNGYRVPSPHNATVQIQTSKNNDESETQIEIFDLPPYPDLGESHSHTTAPPPRIYHREAPSPSAIVVVGVKSTSVASTPRRESSLRPFKITISPDSMIDKEEEANFPGFTLLQMATAQYCQGRYSQALDITTECLAYQKSYFSHEGSVGLAKSATSVTPKGMTNSMTESIAVSAVGKVLGTINGSNAMTSFDSRSSFAAQFGSSVLGVVRSFKSEIPSKEHHSARHQHPMLSNSVSVMISQYPTKPCVVKTLLLRGHVLLACGMHESYDDRSLIVQATKNVEMAVAIQRKLAIDRELARSLIFLGSLKNRMGLFCEADTAYNEAVCILRAIRRIVKRNRLETSENECSKDIKPCDKLDDELTHTLYLHGKSLHCQRKYVQAFHYYNRAFKLCKMRRSSQKIAGVTNIVRCMRKGCALEKLVSAYWDDATVI